MRRALGLIMMAGLVLGVAACGSSGGGSDSSSDTKTTASSDSGSSGGSEGSSNAKVDAYCKAVDEYVQKVKDAEGDPSQLSSLTDEGKELTDKAAALATADLSSDDAKAVADCTKKSTDALMPS